MNLRIKLLALGALSALSLLAQATMNTAESALHWTWLFFYVQIAYTLFSCKIVGATELGALIFLGDPKEEVSSGFVFAPLGLFVLQTDSKLVQQWELPADPEKIYRGDGLPPDGTFPPIRVTSASGDAEGVKKVGNAKDPLDQRRTTYEVVPIIRVRIEKGQYITFLQTVGTLTELRQQFSDTAVAFLTAFLQDATVAYALKNQEEISKEFRTRIESLTEATADAEEEPVKHPLSKWGIFVEEARIKNIPLHHTLNKAIAAPTEADFNAQAVRATAEGERVKRQLEGTGDGEGEEGRIDGRTAGMKRQMMEMGINDPLPVLAAETARGITSNPGQKTIIAGSGGMAGLAAQAVVLEEVLRRDGVPPPPPTTET